MSKTHKGEEVLNSLVKDLNLIYRGQKLRLAVITLSLYSEYIINQLVKRNFKHGLDDDKNATHSIKLKFLSGAKIIEESDYKILNGLREVRNELAHKIPIGINVEKIKKIIDGIEPNYGDDSIKKEFKNKPASARFVWAVISKVFWLISRFYNEEDLRLKIENQQFVLEKF